MKKILLIITLIFLSTSPVFSAVYQENFSVISDIMSAFSVDEKPTIKTATDK